MTIISIDSNSFSLIFWTVFVLGIWYALGYYSLKGIMTNENGGVERNPSVLAVLLYMLVFFFITREISHRIKK